LRDILRKKIAQNRFLHTWINVSEAAKQWLEACSFSFMRDISVCTFKLFSGYRVSLGKKGASTVALFHQFNQWQPLQHTFRFRPARPKC